MKKLQVTSPLRMVHRTATRRIPYSDVLNESQLRAVMHNNGPALVLAGAGTGKTRTLTYRVARLVEDGLDPSRILLLTFTRKAAREMLNRAGMLLGSACNDVAGGTFHSFGYTLLRRFRSALYNEGTSPISVLDQSDVEDAMNVVRSQYNVSSHGKRFPKASLLSTINSKAINTMTELDEVVQSDYPQFIDQTDTIRDVIRNYHAYKHRNALVDYDDLLLLTLAATRNSDICSLLRKQYQQIMVDEYQDTNALQHAIIMGLSGESGNVMAVGDDAQSIYSFRGANIVNMHEFETSFSSCEVIRLEQNYRSTQQILDVCNTIVRDSATIRTKELRSNRTQGELPWMVACHNTRQQSQFIVQSILQLQEEGADLKDIAVLFRSSFLSFDLEIVLTQANIPFRKVGGMRFIEAAHIKDVLSYLRVTENPRDVLAWYRCLKLLDGVGPKTATSILEHFQECENPLHSPLPRISGKAKAALEGLVNVLLSACSKQSAEERIRTITDWYRPTLERVYDDANKRWKEVEVLIGIASQYGTTQQFLADIILDPPSEAAVYEGSGRGDSDLLTLSTIHSAKGLEWSSVFVISVNDGYLPSVKSLDCSETAEEERRLLYVACTRARNFLTLSYTSIVQERENNVVLGQPSRFLENVTNELCTQYVLVEADDESNEHTQHVIE